MNSCCFVDIFTFQRPLSEKILMESDLWSYNSTYNKWTLEQTRSIPPYRIGSSMIYDRGKDRVLLFGGWVWDYPGFRYFNDTWELQSQIENMEQPHIR